MYYLNKIPYDKKLPCRHLAVIQTKLDQFLIALSSCNRSQSIINLFMDPNEYQQLFLSVLPRL